MFLNSWFFYRKCHSDPVDLSIPVKDSIILFRDDIDLTSISRCGSCADLYSRHGNAAITIPCGHTFCEQCIMFTTQQHYCKCPKCDVRQYISYYQKNLALTHFLEKLNFLNEPSNQHILGKSDADIIVLSKNDDRLIEFAECCICFEKYNEDDYAPVTVLCGHTFCDVCVKRLGEEYRCPVCRTSLGKFFKEHKKDEILIKILKKLQLFDRTDDVVVEKVENRIHIKIEIEANQINDKVQVKELSSKNGKFSYLFIFGMAAGLSLMAFRYSRSD